VRDSNWLANGQRSPNVAAAPAMALESWRQPIQTAANRHSVFVDVELRDRQHWSCSFLASVWQLLRLGLLRPADQRLTNPAKLDGELPKRWDDLPPVFRMTDTRNPFCAYRSYSILPTRFMEIEIAARTVMQQVSIPAATMTEVMARGAREGIELSADILDRIDYVFINE
jgi:hypothetical protein